MLCALSCSAVMICFNAFCISTALLRSCTYTRA
jgi:hypothetical protein